MVTLSVVMVIALLAIVTAWYAPLILKNHVHPVPATFIIGCTAFWVASVSHLAASEKSLMENLVSNITLYVATLQTTAVLAVIVYAYTRSGQWRVAFDAMQKTCLAIMLASLVYWYFNKDQAQVTYWTTMFLLVLAHATTAIKIVRRKYAFDSIWNWVLITFAALWGSIPAFVAGNPFGIGNSIRAVVMSAISASLFIYYDHKGGFSRLRSEKGIVLEFYGAMGRKLTYRRKARIWEKGREF